MLNNKRIKLACVGLVLAAYSAITFSHGFIDSPGARNYFCGAVTKPDEVNNGTAEYPECGDAFANDFEGGYQYMSVLNHHEGRKVLGPSTSNVCGFDSETWNGGRTPWDEPINWPVNNISAGPLVFSWDISNGPHFSDTSDFRFWITKPGFQYQVGQDLAWSDFEDQPFCDLDYNHANQGASPAVQADEASAHFYVNCNVPQRSGRHVIYAEWGRTPPTYERFHGCVDVQFGGSNPTPPPVSSSSSVSSTSSSTSVGFSSSVPSVSSSSSAPSGVCEEVCQWYSEGTYPLCENQNSGWGWENNESCISRSTCANSNNSGGIVDECSGGPNPSPSSASQSSWINSSSSSSVSSAKPTGGVCNWYGWDVPVCQNTGSGWSNENGRSCVSQMVCDSQ